MEKKLEEILKRNNLSVTDSRKKILQLFYGFPGALAHNDIEKRAAEKFDRVTIYRTLQTFVDKGIIHTIPTAGNSIRYALCKEECADGHHHDDHIHFLCEKCGKTFCVDEVVMPKVSLPKGYIVTQVEIVVNGICLECKS